MSGGASQKAKEQLSGLDRSSVASAYPPIALLQQEARLLRAVLLVALRLVNAVAVARVLPVHVLLGYKQEIWRAKYIYRDDGG